MDAVQQTCKHFSGMCSPNTLGIIDKEKQEEV